MPQSWNGAAGSCIDLEVNPKHASNAAQPPQALFVRGGAGAVVRGCARGLSKMEERRGCRHQLALRPLTVPNVHRRIRASISHDILLT